MQGVLCARKWKLGKLLTELVCFSSNIRSNVGGDLSDVGEWGVDQSLLEILCRHLSSQCFSYTGKNENEEERKIRITMAGGEYDQMRKAFVS